MRIIARLDIKNKNLIKGINLEGLKIVGEPNKFAIEYYENGIDELIFMDSVASLYGRNNLYDIINEASNNILPLYFTAFAIISANSLIVISFPHPTFIISLSL